MTPWLVSLLAALSFTLVVFGTPPVSEGAVHTVAWYPGANLSNTQWQSEDAALARDLSGGDLFMAWMDRSDAEPGEVMGRRWDGATKTWQPPLGSKAENLSLSEWTDGGPLLFFDREGQGHLLWTRRYGMHQGAPEDGTDLMWRHWSGTYWSPEVLLLHAGSSFPGTYGLIPVTTPNSTLLFITFGNGYRLTEYRNGTWTAVSPWYYLDFPGGIRPTLTDMVMDESGLIHAAAFARNSSQVGNDRWFRDSYYLTFDGISWSEPVNLSWTEGVAHDAGLAFDGHGRLHFLWSDPNSPHSSESRKSAIWERIYEGEAWTPSAEVTSYNLDQTISTFSLAADISGTLHLAWSEGSLIDGVTTGAGIHYTSGDGMSWEGESAVYTASGESRYPLLATGDGNAYLGWQEGSSATRDVYCSFPFEGYEGPVLVFLPWVLGQAP